MDSPTFINNPPHKELVGDVMQHILNDDPLRYSVNHIRASSENKVYTNTIKNRNPDCVVSTKQTKVTLQGAPPNPRTTHKYNLLDHLGKAPTQISILELLCTSLEHNAILDRVVQYSSGPYGPKCKSISGYGRFLSFHTPYILH